MTAKSESTPKQPEQADSTTEEEDQPGSLVPLYGGAIVPGIQAFRRGDIILYTIRGEPKEVLELVGQLDKQGVREVVALISHPAQDEEPSQQHAEEQTEA